MKDNIRYRTNRIGPVLREQGRKQRWLADRVGVHESIVSDWVKGKRTVDAHRAGLIAEILGVPFSLLFDRSFVSLNVTEVATAA